MYTSKKLKLTLKWSCMYRNEAKIDADNSILEREEDSLLNDVRAYKQQALVEAHDRYYSAIFRYIVFKVGDQQTAEDLTGEVFLRFLDALKSHKAPRKTIRGWLYQVANHVVNDYFRKQYRRKSELSLTWEVEGERPKPDVQLTKKVSYHDLYEAIDELTHAQQDVVALRFGFGMPIREVANTVGKSEEAVKQLQARAVASLARILKSRIRS
jgi:RNA polymerase sigma-70 factor (ECF subfamily)